VPKGSFYHYFRSKEDFGVEVIKRYWSNGRQVLTDLLADENKTPIERLEAFFRWGRDRQLESGCRQGCLLAKLGTEISDFSDDLRQALEESTGQWLELLEKGILAAQKAGEIDSRLPAKRLAEFLWAAWEGASTRSLIVQDPAPLDGFLDLAFGGLLAP
ncbi:MAG: TetR family transcriptional regulator C-terminal domain-containing protein, partial [Acidobacteria bacterium]|nr:TetR family transcriptional regulator C-terminal domain-containing protein [Acidobacteriota bacterium]